MKMFTLENDQLKVVIQSKGAELRELYNKQTRLQYMWSADPAFWPKTSPVLFPIVGSLKDDTYHYNGKSYQLTRHGFARDMEFDAQQLQPDIIRFNLKDSETTREKFPFAFELSIEYRLQGDTLLVHYQVVNRATGPLYFSLGAHPAFALPLEPGLTYNDYFLEFDQTETLVRWPISPEGLIKTEPLPLLNNTNQLHLSKDLFYQDALVLKHPLSTRVSLRSAKGAHGLLFDFSGYPFLGLWAVKDADFLCIEPWFGIADSVRTNQQLIDKEGINTLEGAGIFDCQWSVTTF